MYSRLFDTVVFESSIDFPQPDLDPQIWNKERNEYRIREDVRATILTIVDQYPDEDLIQNSQEIRLVGSMGTNLYVKDSDIDVHLVPKDFSEWNEKRVKEVMDWFAHNDKLDKFIGNHPIEVYVQLEPSQDLLSAAVYDLVNDKWLVGPKIVPLDYDPYVEFQNVAGEVKKVSQEADLLMGELKRDVTDFDVIRAAIQNLPTSYKKKLHLRLKNKLVEIEKDIERLYLERKKMVDVRFKREFSGDPEKDMEQAKKWKDANAIFKFANRYQYLKVIGELEELLKDDGEVKPNEVDIIKGVMKNV